MINYSERFKIGDRVYFIAIADSLNWGVICGEQVFGIVMAVDGFGSVVWEYPKAKKEENKLHLGPFSVGTQKLAAFPKTTTILAIVRTADGNIDHWAFADRETMEHDFDSILSWRDRVICVKEVSWTEGEGLSDKET